MPQNNKHIINERRHRVSKFYLEGLPQFKIAEQVGVSQGQISRDLKHLSQQWQESAMVNIDRIKARELAKLDELERRYYEGWNRSLKTQKVKKERETDSDGKITRETSIERKKLIGDYHFLDGILKCVHRRAELLGLDAPSKRAIDVNANLEGLVDMLPEEKVDMILNRILSIQTNENEPGTEAKTGQRPGNRSEES